MKTIYHIIAGCFALLAMCGCEQELPVYDSTDCMLNFEYNQMKTDTLINYSFKYVAEDVVEDTVWVKVTTMGFPADRNRSLELMQISAGNGEEDAVAGKHYLSFDDTELNKKYYIPANAVETKIPIVVKKDESLATKSVSLKVTFKENEEFKLGYIERSTVKVVITDMLVRPNNWEDSPYSLMGHFFGSYGPVKHKLMIDATGEKWDDTYLIKLGFDNPASVDQGYLMFLGRKIANRLQEVNDERAAEGLGRLTEADGTVVKFPF